MDKQHSNPIVTSAIFICTIVLFLLLRVLFPCNSTTVYPYDYIENVTIKLLLATILAILMVHKITKHDHPTMTITIGGSLGIIFFTVILGLKMADPTNINWLMRGDWEIHFMGWHFFRQEPWQWPIGKISNYFFPLGTSIGYTDSIPILAFLLKPFDALLPAAFQYLGLWILICYTLQGLFASLLMRLISRDLLVQTLGALFFIMSPILLNRIGHIALCSHWILLSGLWLYFKNWKQTPPIKPFIIWATLIFISALIHPYITVMLFGLTIAFYGRYCIVEQRCKVLSAMSQIVLLGVPILLAWWQTGYFLLDSKNMPKAGFGKFSMNLFAPFNAMGGGSAFFRGIEKATTGQGEGFNYLGAGVLFLGICTVYEITRRAAHKATIKKILPLAIVCFCFTIVAVSNKITLGPSLLFEFHSRLLNILSIFHGSGRFFWPVNYTLLFLIINTIIKRNSPRTAIIFLSIGLALQALDMRPLYQSHHDVRHEPAKHWNPDLATWKDPLQSIIWQTMTPYYQHITLYPSPLCGEISVQYLPFANLAGHYGITINYGKAARFNQRKIDLYCREFNQDILMGNVNDDTIYILHHDYLEQFQESTKVVLSCEKIDGFDTCITLQSTIQWHPNNKPFEK